MWDIPGTRNTRILSRGSFTDLSREPRLKLPHRRHGEIRPKLARFLARPPCRLTRHRARCSVTKADGARRGTSAFRGRERWKCSRTAAGSTTRNRKTHPENELRLDATTPCSGAGTLGKPSRDPRGYTPPTRFGRVGCNAPPRTLPRNSTPVKSRHRPRALARELRRLQPRLGRRAHSAAEA